METIDSTVMTDDNFLNAFINRLLQGNRLGSPIPEGVAVTSSVQKSVDFKHYDFIKFGEETETEHFTVHGDSSTLRYFDLGKIRGVRYYAAFYVMKNNFYPNEKGKGNLLILSLWSDFGKEEGLFVKIVTMRYVFHCSQKVARRITLHEFRMQGGKFGENFMSNSKPDPLGLVYDYIRGWIAIITSAERNLKL